MGWRVRGWERWGRGDLKLWLVNTCTSQLRCELDNLKITEIISQKAIHLFFMYIGGKEIVLLRERE